jgi:hypothetical protein
MVLLPLCYGVYTFLVGSNFVGVYSFLVGSNFVLGANSETDDLQQTNCTKVTFILASLLRNVEQVTPRLFSSLLALIGIA